MGQTWSHYQQKRNVSALSELAPQKTPGQDATLLNLTHDTLIRALHHVTASIAKAKGNMTVISVSSAVNTIYLQSRSTTHDVDFFNNYLTAEDYELLIKAIKEATKKDSLLDEQWFNNRTIFFIPMEKRSTLTEEAFRQHDVVFTAPGLTILAAPWHYAFCCKIDRLAGSGLYDSRPYDQDDAVQYLSQYLAKTHLATVSKQTVQTWFEQYSL